MSLKTIYVNLLKKSLKNSNVFSVKKCGYASQYYPIDEQIFGLTEDQQQVS